MERSTVLFRPLMGLAEEIAPSFLVSIFLTQLVWNVQMFPFGNGRPAQFAHTQKERACERGERGAQSHVLHRTFSPLPTVLLFRFSVKLAPTELAEKGNVASRVKTLFLAQICCLSAGQQDAVVTLLALRLVLSQPLASCLLSPCFFLPFVSSSSHAAEALLSKQKILKLLNSKVQPV